MAFTDICVWSKLLPQDRGEVNGHYKLAVAEAEEVFAFINQEFRLNVNHFIA